MLLITNPPCFHVQNSRKAYSCLSSHRSVSLCLALVPKKRAKGPDLARFRGFDQPGVNLDKTWRCWSRLSDGDAQLEEEIMDFMENSEKPTMFPTEEELRKGGRGDLAEAIRRRGGWLALGWGEEPVGSNFVEEAVVYDTGKSRLSPGYYNGRGFTKEPCGSAVSRNFREESFSSEESMNSRAMSSSHSAGLGMSERSLEIGAHEDSGIQGILCRLEKQRDRDLGIGMEKNGNEARAETELDRNYRNTDTMSDFANIGDGAHQKGTPSASDSLSSTEPESWRSWVSRRAGLHDFEAGEINYRRDQPENNEKNPPGLTTLDSENNLKAVDDVKEMDHSQIRARLQDLEVELKAVLHSLKSKRMEYISKQLSGNVNNLEKLADAWEFKENEFMSSQECLRSIRAKIAVLEGKMALAIIDSRRQIEIKQKRIDEAQRALKFLRTTSVVWATRASEVLLAGSFDGWTTKRKMNRSETGEFSLYLKLYPGRYEIKFIVDGVWRIDPLRPIVNHSGHENNLLIVS